MPMTVIPGIAACSMKIANAVLAMPATRLLIVAIITGSPEEMLRVRLLSIPHATHAPAIASGPRSASTDGAPLQESAKPPTMINAIPTTVCREACSRNANHAINAVATASRLRRSDAVAAADRERPTISITGPTTPPVSVAAQSHNQSLPTSGASKWPRYQRMASIASSPTPEPKYRSPASNPGLTWPNSAFAAGVLAPKSAAEPIA